MKKSDQEWYKLLLGDPKLRKNWLKEQERMKQALALEEQDEDDHESRT